MYSGALAGNAMLLDSVAAYDKQSKNFIMTSKRNRNLAEPCSCFLHDTLRVHFSPFEIKAIGRAAVPILSQESTIECM